MSAIDPGNAENSTTRNFLAALAVNGAFLTIEVGAFLVLKQKLWRIYTPRVYLPPPDKRAQELPSGPWKWLPALIVSPTKDIIHKNGLDAYMFLRFLKLLIWIFVAFTVLTFAVIVPVDSINVSSDLTGLERISWSNIIAAKDQSRFSAHIIVVYLLTFFVLYMIRRELQHFVQMRHQFLISKSHSRLAQARTVLITSVPVELANEKDLSTFASFVPGGVDRVWLYRDTKKLNELFERRQEACEKMEAATADILREANKAWRKKMKALSKVSTKRTTDEERNDAVEAGAIGAPVSWDDLDELVPFNQRPKHRTGFCGLVVSKVDTFVWCKEEISRLNKEIKDSREHIVKGKFLGSAFIRCNLQMGAHVLAQCVSYHQPLLMHNKWMEAHPKDVVWRNLDDGALEMTSRYVISWLATAGLIIAWAFPVTFIGTLSNLDSLCQKIHWLNWICKSPKVVSSIIQGVLPPALLAALFTLLPVILRMLAWYECIPRYSLISVSVYRRFYAFLLIHGFLIVTLSSGIAKAIQEIVDQPTHTIQQLASELPGASVFFLTYMVTQGFAGAGSALIQLFPVIIYFVRKWFLGRTPRQAYSVTFLMPSVDFGIVLPRLSLLATIAFTYSVLSPLINLLALLSYGMFYLAFKFLLTQVFDQRDEMETGGMYFPMAINNLFVGLYIEQICLACLFFLKTSISRGSSIAEGALMIVLLVITGCAQIFYNYSYAPITNYLPMSLATKKMAMRYEKRKNKGTSNDTNEDYDDLFSRTRIRDVRKRVKAATKKLDAAIGGIKAKVKTDIQYKEAENNDVDEEKPGKESQDTVAEATGIEMSPLERIPQLSRNGSSVTASSAVKPTVIASEPPAPPADLPGDGDEGEVDEEEDDDVHAFDHPSTYVAQSCIWLPKDLLGFSKLISDDLNSNGVDASDVGAMMDKKGVVEVTRTPPDEEWAGGHDH